MTKLRIAQIGFGQWGPNLAKALQSHPFMEFKYLADNSSQQLELAKSLYPDLIAINEWQKLPLSSIDAVIIATPAYSHHEIAKYFLNNHKHVFVEKPFATSYEDARELLEISLSNNLVAMTGHIFLFHDGLRYIKKNLFLLGKLFHITSYRHNFGSIRSDVNCWWNLAPHDISMLLYLMDGNLPSSILMVGHSFIQKDIEDFCIATLEWPNGVTAQISTNWYTPHKTRKMFLVGSEKMIVFDDTKQNKVEIHSKSVRFENNILKHVNQEILKPDLNYQEPLFTEINHFYECITKGKPCLTGASHACDTIQILEAGSLSMKNGGKQVEICSREFQNSIC